MGKKKKKKKAGYTDIELNLMPFIDAFSILVTFLLMSAVFVVLGMIEVQIPFLAPPSKDVSKPVRTLSLKVEMEKDKIFVVTSYSKAPVNEVKKKFKVNEAGYANLHKYLVKVKIKNPDLLTVSFYSEDDVKWKDMALVLDAIKLRNNGDPVFPNLSKENIKNGKPSPYAGTLFPKVVFSSVML